MSGNNLLTVEEYVTTVSPLSTDNAASMDADSPVSQLTPPPKDVDAEISSLEIETGTQLTQQERERFKQIKQEVTDYQLPQNFMVAIPNLLRGFDTKFTKASEDPKLAAESKTPELLAAEAEAQKFLLKNQTEYALLFAATEVSLATVSIDDWKPLHVPHMFGRTKILLVHNTVWKILENASFIVRHHPSMTNLETSEVFEIYIMQPNGAAIEYVANRKCVGCDRKPAPILCNSCKAPYCEELCRRRDKDKHDIDCISSIMKKMTTTVKNGRERFNQNLQVFNKEQSAFEERNRGKLVTVRRIDKDGTVISETQQIVVPAIEPQQ